MGEAQAGAVGAADSLLASYVGRAAGAAVRANIEPCRAGPAR